MIHLNTQHTCKHFIRWELSGNPASAPAMGRALNFVSSVKLFPCPFCGAERGDPTMIRTLADQSVVGFDNVPGIKEVRAHRTDEQIEQVVTELEQPAQGEEQERTYKMETGATPAQQAEYRRRCAQIGLSWQPQGHAEDGIKRLTILTEVMTGRALHFDPIAATYGRKAPVPQWLHESRRRP